MFDRAVPIERHANFSADGPESAVDSNTIPPSMMFREFKGSSNSTNVSSLSASLHLLPEVLEHPQPLLKIFRAKHDNKTILSELKEKKEISFLHDFVAGGVAGCASVVVGHPLDT
jgi:hypothetical protein